MSTRNQVFVKGATQSAIVSFDNGIAKITLESAYHNPLEFHFTCDLAVQLVPVLLQGFSMKDVTAATAGSVAKVRSPRAKRRKPRK